MVYEKISGLLSPTLQQMRENNCGPHLGKDRALIYLTNVDVVLICADSTEMLGLGWKVDVYSHRFHYHSIHPLEPIAQSLT